MITEKGTMHTEVTFSSDRKHRYTLSKIWDDGKPLAMIIMTNPSSADLLTIDYTTLYILNNMAKLDFGGVIITNMVSEITTKLDTKGDIVTTSENIEQILKCAEKVDTIILAFGKIGENNKKVRAVQDSLIEKLMPFKEKLHLIADDSGASGFHPLASQIRFTWHLVKFELPKKSEPETKLESGSKEENSKEEVKEEKVKQGKKSDKKAISADDKNQDDSKTA